MELMKGKKPIRTALGRGLSSLISTPMAPVSFHENAVPNVPTEEPFEPANQSEFDEVGKSAIRYLDIEKIVNNPKQPRQKFEKGELEDLARSIKEVGVLQPVLVRPSPIGTAGTFEIVAGERRWRAAKLAGAYQLPVIINSFDDRATLEISIIENIQRENLDPVEQARAYERLSTEFSLSHEEIAEKVGKDRASVSNYIRLLKLPSEVLALISTDKLSMGHAKAILSIKEPSAQLSLARKVVSEGLSVRELEGLVSRVVVLDAGKVASKRSREGKGNQKYSEVIDRLRHTLGTKVQIRHHPTGKGKIEIEYFSEQELDRIIDLICPTHS